MPAQDTSLYLHVPFCTTKCTYCAFNTYTHLEALIEPFTRALIRELEIVAEARPHLPVGTVFFGGGTPSLLSPEQFERILDTIARHFDLDPAAEITFEANPDDLDRGYLTQLHALGFNRISIGMQTAHANELALFNRRHDNDAVARAVSGTRLSGFDNLNLDIMYGFPHQTLESWRGTLDAVLALKPDHVSLYALSLEEGTPMKLWVDRGRLPAPDEDLAADMYELASEMLDRVGYHQYEISNWARPGYECRHNLQYWHNYDYIGVGPGAQGWAGGVRYATVLAPQRYIRLLDGTAEAFDYPYTPAVVTAEKLDRETVIAETLIMGLRLIEEGIHREAFRTRFGQDLIEVRGDVLNKYAAYGLLTIDDEHVRLTPRGRLLSNLIFRELV